MAIEFQKKHVLLFLCNSFSQESTHSIMYLDQGLLMRRTFGEPGNFLHNWEMPCVLVMWNLPRKITLQLSS